MGPDLRARSAAPRTSATFEVQNPAPRTHGLHGSAIDRCSIQNTWGCSKRTVPLRLFLSSVHTRVAARRLVACDVLVSLLVPKHDALQLHLVAFEHLYSRLSGINNRHSTNSRIMGSFAPLLSWVSCRLLFSVASARLLCLQALTFDHLIASLGLECASVLLRSGSSFSCVKAVNLVRIPTFQSSAECPGTFAILNCKLSRCSLSGFATTRVQQQAENTMSRI